MRRQNSWTEQNHFLPDSSEWKMKDLEDSSEKPPGIIHYYKAV